MDRDGVTNAGDYQTGLLGQSLRRILLRPLQDDILECCASVPVPLPAVHPLRHVPGELVI